MNTLVFATNNAHKLGEVRQILGGSFEVLGLKDIGCEADIPETADTFEGNAWQKARYVKEHFGYDCMADDSGLEVDALGGEPGVHSARYAATADGQGHDSEANIDLLLAKMQDVEDRSARFRTALALICKGEEQLFNGTVEGRILTERHGTGGFGYDPVFQPEGFDQSFAEMTAGQKNAISHRGRAIQQLVKYLAVLLCLLLPMQAFAQAIGTWKVFPAYNVCSKNVPAGNRVYALMTSKLMAYDTDDTSIKAWDVTNGLSDMTITDIAYSEEAKCIVIVYDNGNIDLLSTDDDDYIVNLAQLKNSSLQGKEVNSISVYGQTAYLCTGFGLVVINLMDAVISSTYKLGMGVTACAVSDDAIYVGNSDGIWRGKRADNLQDKANWKHINSDIDVSMMSFFDGRVCVAVHGNFYISDAAGETYTSCEKFTPSYIHVEDGKMVVGNTANFSIYSDSSHRKYYNTGGTWADVHVKGNTLWVSEGTSGLQAYSIQEDKTFSLITASIQLNSPLYDYSYHLSFAGTRLLVAGGNYNYSSVSLPGAAMILEPDGTWVNFDPATATAFNKASRYIDVTDIAQDPDDATHHFVGTARSGLYEFRDAKCIGHYSCHNSPLKSILPSNSHAQWFVVADGNRFDSDGNLWMLNPAEGVSDTIIRILMHDGSWQGQQYDELSGVTAMDNILFDSRGWAWINSRRMEGRGIFCLDYNGTVSQRSDDRHILRSNIINQDGTTYTPDEFYCMAEDIDGTIWIGTNDGPFRIASPEDFFSSSFSYEQMKVARNDGSGLADYLLSSIPIRTIAIDGAGRKWFGTLSNGVYLISADCQEQIYHFTTDNSPIPSNDVENIAINGATGEVFFATTKGLCCFVSDATDPVDDISDNELFVFPNPVTPDYTGPIAVRGLTAGSEVKIVAPSGQIIYSGYSNGGTFTWNGTNQRGSRVASGVYLIIASKSDGSKAASSKVAIIR